MSKKPETKFKERVLPLLRTLPHSWWFKTQMIALRGIPDIIGCLNGTFVALELKYEDDHEKGELAPLQGYILRKIIEAGGLALECTPENWPETLAVLQKIARLKATYRPEEKPSLESLDS